MHDAPSENVHGFHFGLEDMAEVAFVTDHHHVITDVNAVTLRTFGYSREEMIGWPLERFFPAQPRGTSLLMAGTSGASKFEIRLRTKSGGSVHMSIVASPVRREGGVAGILYLGRDIRLRKLVEGEIRKARDYYRAVLQDAPNGICITDLNRNVIVANRTVMALTGKEMDEIIGGPVTDLYPEDDALRELDVEALWKGAKPTHEFEMVSRAGAKTPVMVMYRAVEDDNGERMIVESFIDISDRKRLDRLKNEFVFIAAHELRNPVGAIRLLLNMIFEDKRISVDEAMRGYLLKMQEADDRLLQLVDDLLEVSRNESGRLRIDRTPQDIFAQVEQILGETRPHALTRDVTLVHRPLPVMPKVLGDERKIKEVFANLITNGIKYNVAGGTVTVSYEVRGEMLAVRVADEGIGISKEDVARLFEKFWRSEDYAVRAQPGTGLGLYIVKELVERMGGTIAVESATGKGTAFTFTLMLAK